MEGNPNCGIREIFARGIRNLEVWNLECSQGVRNLTKDWNPESQFHRQRKPVPYPESGIRNPWRGIQNPRLSGIPLHGATTKSTWVIRQFSKT